MKSFFAAAVSFASVAIAEQGNWTTKSNHLYYKDEAVVLHGFSTSCPPYLIQKLSANDGKTRCWANYNHNDPENIITELNTEQADAAIGYLTEVKGPGVMPTFRVPLCASSWLGVETDAAKSAMSKYPDLGGQYQTLISSLVTRFTEAGIVVILDLHWNSDDIEQSPMALQAGEKVGGSIEFWESVAAKFKDNELVFYELYNEPHLTTDQSDDIYLNGDDTYVGMLQMIEAVRKHSPDQVLVIAGAREWAFDNTSLIELDSKTDEELIVYNYHAYMNPANPKALKNADSLEAYIQEIQSKTDKPAILTEFGQFCCATNGSCGLFEGTWDGKDMGYAEAVVTIAETYGVSWTP